jgi:predicted metal-dependent hydrolase
MPPKKRTLETLASVDEPHPTPSQFDAWHDGIELFDRREYWQAHERWESLWRVMGDSPSDDWEIVIRGFIQLAAGLHLVGIGRLDGARSNLEKAAAKLALAPSSFLGIDVEGIRVLIDRQLDALPEALVFRLRQAPPSDATAASPRHR